MCGTISQAADVSEAVDFALAYVVDLDEQMAAATKREYAKAWVDNYVPYKLRDAATSAIESMPDEQLTTTTKYWGDVVR